MREGRSKEDWLHTSAILAQLSEPHRDRKKFRRPFKPSDFNPHYQERIANAPKIKVGVEALRVFL